MEISNASNNKLNNDGGSSDESFNNSNGHPPNKKLLTSPQQTFYPNNINSNNIMDSTDSNFHNTSVNSIENNNDESMLSTSASNLNNNDNIDDESRAEATFQLVINDFSKFRESRESRVSSTPCIVRNLPWKILAMSKQLNNREFVLGFFLQCNADSESTRWSVCAAAELRLLHLMDQEKNLVKSII